MLKKIAAYEKIIREAEAEPAQKEEVSDQPEVAKTVYQEQTRTLGKIIQMKLEANSEELKINDLYALANEIFEGTQADGVWNIKDLYDSLELGINLYLLNNKELVNIFNSGDIESFISKVKTDVLLRIPTQTKRTEEMDEFQQFSTPPSIASLAAWLANINKNDFLLEPSAGIGGLAIFGKMAGAKVVVNELSQRRAEILSNLPFDQFFTENGEQINNILPDDVAPTVVVMNPPFSSTAGRVQGERKTKNGGVHVEQALKRLQPGGRLVAIVGQGMSFEHSTFRDWWNKIRKEYNVLANVGLSGQEYKKYGTTFDNRILVIDKTGATTGQPVSGDYNNIESMVDALQGVRNVRQAISSGAETSSADANKSEGKEVSGLREPGRSSKRHGDTSLRTSKSDVGLDQIQQERDNAKTDQRGRLSGDVRADGDVSAHSNNENTGVNASINRRRDIGDESKDRRRNGSSSDRQPLRNDGSEQLEVSQTERTDKGELSDSIYDEYRPSVTVAGAKKHPGKLVESAAMAAVSPAKVNYTPKIPSEAVRAGKISDAQLEAVIRAGNNHNQKLLDGKRKGFFIGDGTGVGKGREISAVFWDNFLQGRKKGVWVTKNSDLFKDARRDIEGIGWDKSIAFELNDYDDIKRSEGVLLISYDTLKGKSKDGRTRLEQINKWLGENFDGVIAFDEAHMMANSVTTQSSRGKQKPSERALKGFDFRQQNPDARVLYVSATGATEPSNLGYLERLGLWGPGTPFGSVDAFIAEVTSGGVAAMEMIAADMKAMGNYIARSLSFDGVTYGRLSHELTPEQQKVYGTYCTAWQT
ncbi:MAG TPA: strawberry notch family protein, partial [Candidatus Rifleibacterium sp.]|nr:strawberry notch family protein [Candidatus Rifleibacterium sp.]